VVAYFVCEENCGTHSRHTAFGYLAMSWNLDFENAGELKTDCNLDVRCWREELPCAVTRELPPRQSKSEEFAINADRNVGRLSSKIFCLWS
jgi:hypothetical protein